MLPPLTKKRYSRILFVFSAFLAAVATCAFFVSSYSLGCKYVDAVREYIIYDARLQHKMIDHSNVTTQTETTPISHSKAISTIAHATTEKQNVLTTVQNENPQIKVDTTIELNQVTNANDESKHPTIDTTLSSGPKTNAKRMIITSSLYPTTTTSPTAKISPDIRDDGIISPNNDTYKSMKRNNYWFIYTNNGNFTSEITYCGLNDSISQRLDGDISQYEFVELNLTIKFNGSGTEKYPKAYLLLKSDRFTTDLRCHYVYDLTYLHLRTIITQPDPVMLLILENTNSHFYEISNFVVDIKSSEIKEITFKFGKTIQIDNFCLQ